MDKALESRIVYISIIYTSTNKKLLSQVLFTTLLKVNFY